MEKIFLWIQGHNRRLVQILMLILSSVIIVQFISRELQFYEYEKGKPWMHDDLTAPFTFSIIKTELELEEERRTLINGKDLFFVQSDSTEELQIQKLKDLIANSIGGQDSLVSQFLKGKYLLQKGEAILKELYGLGLIETPEEIESRNDKTIFLKKGITNEQISWSDFYTLSDARKEIDNQIAELDSLNRGVLQQALYLSLLPNVVFDRELTQKSLDAKLSLILPYKGQVQEGEIVIFKGNLIDDDKVSKLNSLKIAYEGSFWKRANFIIIFIGRVLLVFGFLLLLFLYIDKYYPELLLNSKNLSLILIHLIFIAGLTSMIKEVNTNWYLASPILLLPIVYMSFFSNKLALVISIVGIVIIGFLVPNAFEFLIIQGIMVLTTSITYQGFLKRGQYFITIGKILGVYLLTFIIYTLIQQGTLNELEYEKLLYYSVSGFLGLFAIPILYIYEKTFKLLSDTTLLELSDTNNKLLRNLSESAPGTFQHTLQVANLAEKGVTAIGGRALLVRTGALYHDIGKSLNPQYFIENQITGVNPQDELSFAESAEIIINHVIKGIELGRRSALPDEIIDFIRTHHGT
ncbi:MAG: HDIG domain-containing protein, partial [Schleiferiaceae bacterium]|nr:HDIG domain-containing protein [Schleiferiaceae bacterium]